MNSPAPVKLTESDIRLLRAQHIEWEQEDESLTEPEYRGRFRDRWFRVCSWVVIIAGLIWFWCDLVPGLIFGVWR